MELATTVWVRSTLEAVRLVASAQSVAAVAGSLGAIDQTLFPKRRVEEQGLSTDLPGGVRQGSQLLDVLLRSARAAGGCVSLNWWALARAV